MEGGVRVDRDVLPFLGYSIRCFAMIPRHTYVI